MASTVAFVSFTSIHRVALIAAHSLRGRRWFSVKEISWCAPSGSPNRRQTVANGGQQEASDETLKLVPISRFGVVAAMSRNQVIGLNGKIPWRLPDDRKLFKDLTRDRILVVGRRTFEEEPNKCHISHVRHCIVVSKTLDPAAIEAENIHLSRSFPEALNVARLLAEDGNKDLHQSPDGIDCWVGGGQAMYQEALKHPSAQQLYLTVVNMDVDESLATTDKHRIAFFPAKYRWDHLFEEVSRQDVTTNDKNGLPDCTYFVYKRRPRR